MDDYSKLRKYENTLSISGAAVIAFGLWSIIKAGLYLAAASPKELFGFFKPEDLEKMNTLNVSASGVTGIILFGIFSALFIDLLLRLYVGRAAVVDGRHLKKKSIIYVIVSVFLAFGLVSTIVTRIVPSGEAESTAWEKAVYAMDASFIVDLTSLFALIEMIIAAIMVRKLRKKLGITETEES